MSQTPFNFSTFGNASSNSQTNTGGTGLSAFGNTASTTSGGGTNQGFSFGSKPATTTAFGGIANNPLITGTFQAPGTSTNISSSGLKPGNTTGNVFTFGNPTGSGTGTTTTTAPSLLMPSLSSIGTTAVNKSSFGWPSTSTATTSAQLFSGIGGSGGTTTAPSMNYLSRNIFQGTGTSATNTSTLGISTGQFNINSITKKTRFSDLPENIKNELIKIDKHIQDQKILMSSINSMTLPNIKLQLQDVNNEIYALSQKVSQINNDIQSDQTIMKDLLNDTYIQSSYAETVRQFYDAASRGQNDTVKQFGDTVFLKFYYDLILSFDSRLQQYEINIEELDRQFKNLNDKSRYESSSALSESLHNQYATLMSVAGKVAFLHENVEALKQKYLNFMKTNFLEDTNPFTQ
ncbi:24121_t:CDS:2 [Entrophospora sp. SA101]|nr:7473_t:CDS:2 [Entrophospora sp. SA101]CAJ0637723.1 2268_t:CDS:2 [Entrophospora sp. SA101]CAJ0768325.1 24121_t:CDS:2 [Entrophospora sp. SA101]CAJ0825330.1 6593_t:CDS:2 [Entrophospora sp. SA101]CAJ0825781.1 7134_t:CDS:2 [Entrophospora sp. SA101]